MPPYQPIEVVFFHSLQKGPLNVDIRFGGLEERIPGITIQPGIALRKKSWAVGPQSMNRELPECSLRVL